MTSQSLAHSLIHQARRRLLLVHTAHNAGDYHIAVREAQEVVELALKGMLRAVGCEPAKVHDVSRDLLQMRPVLEQLGITEVEKLATISKKLRKERENAFYGDVDLLPEDFYDKDDSESARSSAIFCVENAEKALKSLEQ